MASRLLLPLKDGSLCQKARGIYLFACIPFAFVRKCYL